MIHRPIHAHAAKEIGIGKPIDGQARQAIGGTSIHHGELAAHHDIVIRLHSQSENRGIGTRPRVEAGIKGTIRVQPRNVVLARDTASRSKGTTDDHLAGGLDHHGIYRRVQIGPRIKRCIERTIQI